MPDKTDDRVGYFNSILAQGAENLNDPILKNTIKCPGEEGCCFELIGALQSNENPAKVKDVKTVGTKE